MYLDDNTWNTLRNKSEDLESEFQKFISLDENSEESINKIVLDYILPLPSDDLRDLSIVQRRMGLTSKLK